MLPYLSSKQLFQKQHQLEHKIQVSVSETTPLIAKPMHPSPSRSLMRCHNMLNISKTTQLRLVIDQKASFAFVILMLALHSNITVFVLVIVCVFILCVCVCVCVFVCVFVMWYMVLIFIVVCWLACSMPIVQKEFVITSSFLRPLRFVLYWS